MLRIEIDVGAFSNAASIASCNTPLSDQRPPAALLSSLNALRGSVAFTAPPCD
jgi:hypothetical protein